MIGEKISYRILLKKDREMSMGSRRELAYQQIKDMIFQMFQVRSTVFHQNMKTFADFFQLLDYFTRSFLSLCRCKRARTFKVKRPVARCRFRPIFSSREAEKRSWAAGWIDFFGII